MHCLANACAPRIGGGPCRDPDAKEFYGDMDTLNLYVKKCKLPQALRSRLREFARYQHVTRSLQVSSWSP